MRRWSVAVAVGLPLLFAVARVPDVTGMSPSAAKGRLRLSAFRMNDADRRERRNPSTETTIESQRPAPGSLAVPGTSIVVSWSAPEEQVVVPNVVGFWGDDAQERLAYEGFDVQGSSRDIVTSMTPSPGSVSTYGATVILETSVFHGLDWTPTHGVFVLREGIAPCPCHYSCSSGGCHEGSTAYVRLRGAPLGAPAE